LDILETDLRDYIYRLTSLSSAESVLLYYANHSEIDKLISTLDVESLDQVLPKRNPLLKQIRSEVLPAFFRTADKERKTFIDSLLQSIFILHMIQLDPKCSALVQAQVVGGTIYLDTNFLFRLL